MKIAYINFLNHCYVDTEVEMKEIYTSNHMWKLFENFLVDICRVRLNMLHFDSATSWLWGAIIVDTACRGHLLPVTHMQEV